MADSHFDGLLLSDDLIFTSRIVGTAHDLGLRMTSASTMESLLELVPQCTPQGIVLDLACPGLDLAHFVARIDELGESKPRLIAYGSHVDTARLQAARLAGCEPVLPRSKFVEVLPTALPEWLR